MSSNATSWENVGKWYNQVVGEEGHFYHQSLIIPEILKICNFNNASSLLDLACGQGILSRHLPKINHYTGIDAASSLIKAAQEYNRDKHYQYIVGDITKPLSTNKKDFSHATLILALQNIENALAVFKNAYHHLQVGGLFVIVINHPCFRIPRQSSWKVDAENKIQYRRIDRYMTPMKIPIQTNPGKGKKSENTWSFHYPLSSYTKWLAEAGFSIHLIDEWCSNKISEGKAAKMENRSREEIPLFMAITGKKLN